MRFPWPFRRKPVPRLKAIYISPGAAQPMQSVDRIGAQPGAGLEGDRYHAGTGHWQATDACQVTLISEDDLQRTTRRAGGALAAALQSGHHRRNLVIDGIGTRQLENKTFRIGTAVFAYDRPRPPCGHLDRVEGSGLARALGRHSGICLKVLDSGVLSVGDALEIID